MQITMKLRIFLIAVFFLTHVAAFASAAENTAPSNVPAKKLTIGIKQIAPFVIKSPEGTFSGISIDLWRELAIDMNLNYEFVEYDLNGLINALSDGTVDIGIAALSVTPEREEKFDFSQPYYHTGLGIAVSTDSSYSSSTFLTSLLSWDVAKTILYLALMLLSVGFLVWVFERSKNPNHFGGGVVKGVASGFWWSAVSMTTIGYGDKYPITLGGRLVALFWMFTAILMISTFTATMSSSITVNKLQSAINSPDDLAKIKVGTVKNSTSEKYLNKNNRNYEGYKTASESLEALSQKKVGAVVYDIATLQYLVNTEFNGVLRVLPVTFEKQNYAIALPLNSPMRKQINHALLNKLSQPNWQSILYRYLGDAEKM
ncbi:MAG: transporter substrate-binding domain-containing protein [Methylococcaceae bacterium]